MKFFFLTIATYLFLSTAPADAQKADHPLWVRDHRTGKSHPINEVNRIANPQFSTPEPKGYSPQQIHRAYGFDKIYAGQKPIHGAGEIISIVSAFHYPTAAHDMKKYIRTFGLKKMYGLPDTDPCTVATGPHPCFEVVFARGVQPPVDPLWALESALDIQLSHSIAQSADIILVEASSNNFVDLFQAVLVASNLNSTVISMSWGGTEFSNETIFEPLFNRTGISFVAASGDTGVPSYPATSPLVLAVGGTTLPLDRHGNRIGEETAWSGSGGGISPFFAIPPYQSNFPIPNSGGLRGNPDVAFNGDPDTGMSIFTTTPVGGEVGWISIAGTSAGAPQWAGLLALANQLRNQTLSTNNLVMRPQYDAATGHDYRYNYRDIKTGTNGTCGAVCTAVAGYDFVTGLGSPRAENLVRFLGRY